MCLPVLSSLPPPAGESGADSAGRSPTSASTLHSSPPSGPGDFSFTNNLGAAPAPAPGAPGPGSGPSEEAGLANTLPSDVVINRKESEGFGFVIISSLNRPEAPAAVSEFLLLLFLNPDASKPSRPLQNLQSLQTPSDPFRTLRPLRNP